MTETRTKLYKNIMFGKRYYYIATLKIMENIISIKIVIYNNSHHKIKSERIYVSPLCFIN